MDGSLCANPSLSDLLERNITDRVLAVKHKGERCSVVERFSSTVASVVEARGDWPQSFMCKA